MAVQRAWAQSGTDPAVESQLYHDQILEWRMANETKLKSPTGWLALTGHYWLDDSVSSIGKGPDSVVQIPAEVSEPVDAKLETGAGQVVLTQASDSQILVDGQHRERTSLSINRTELDADSTNTMTIGAHLHLHLQLVQRSGRLAVRVRDANSASIRQFRGKNWFAVDEKFRVKARFVPYDEEHAIRIVNIRGEETEMRVVGYATFEVDDKVYRLDALTEGPGDLFFVFKDKTCGKESYAPGRFLNVERPSKADFILDFNKAYNPPCAFSPHTLCPLPPSQNHLDIEIRAGEKKYEK